MPLGDAQAKALISKARQAPYGKGSETIVDTAVRNTWELDARQFMFCDPNWPAYLREVCQHVAHDLGIVGTVKPEIYKMLLYEEGYRWVLTYNLALNHSLPRPSAQLLRSHTQPLRDTLRRWLAQEHGSREMEYVYHVLAHDYTEANISLKALKTQDLARVQALKEVCSDLPVEIFLGLLEKREWGCCEFEYDPYSRYGGYEEAEEDEEEGGFHALEEVFETTYTVKKLVDLDGWMVSKDLHLDDEDLLDENCFDDVDAREPYEGYMGNSGPSAIHWYHVAAVAIVPHDSISSYLGFDESYCTLEHNYSSPIGYLARKCLVRRASDALLNSMVDSCRQIWNPRQPKGTGMRYRDMNRDLSHPLAAGDMRDVLKVALHHGQYDLFEEAITKCNGIPASDFFIWVKQWLGTGDDFDERWNVIRKGITSIIQRFPRFSSRVQAVVNLAPAPKDLLSQAVHTPDGFLDWVRKTLRTSLADAVEPPSQIKKADGPAMVDLALYFDDPSNFLSENVVSKLERHDDLAFRLAFLARLRELNTTGALSTEDSKQVYQTIANSLVSTDFASIQSLEVAQSEAKAARYSFSTLAKPSLDHVVSHEELAAFFASIIRDSGGLATSLAAKMTDAAPQIRPLELYYLWMPFLQALVPSLILTNTPLDTPCYRQLFIAIFSAFSDRFIKAEPTEVDSYALQSVSCFCDICTSVNAFLANPNERELDDENIPCTHITWRSQEPQTLVVTKSSLYGVKREAWENRRTLALTRMEGFQGPDLQQLLGPEYMSFMTMDRVSAMHQPSMEMGGHGPVAPLPVASLPAAGEKRKRSATESEVIDLTSPGGGRILGGR